jgi:O-acetyl-ADP-ribose deacetylase (regulator of RNase III)
MIHYIKGDATNPQTPGKKLIVHVCNDIGGWGAGFVLAISKRWRLPELCYRGLKAWLLGTIQAVKVTDDITVVNMIAQHGIMDHRTKGVIDIDAKPAIRYEALATCMAKVRDLALQNNCTIHMPRIGCGLAGGKWDEVEKILEDQCSDVFIFVYDYEPQTTKV